MVFDSLDPISDPSATIAALEGLTSALPMIAGIAFGVGGLASFVLAVSELMQVEALSPALQFLAGLMLLTVAWAVSRKPLLIFQSRS